MSEMASTAKECGIRCKKFRNLLGMSQKDLADKIGTTAANISKLEREGIYNIEMIQQISDALNHNILDDEFDEEGHVGEIGRSILLKLVANKGKLDSAEIFNHMLIDYGLRENAVIKELIKLEKIGMCTRESYLDPYGKAYDEVYITAKGCVTIENGGVELPRYGSSLGKYISTVTYEKKCCGYDNIQERMDALQINRNVLKLKPVSAYRINFINYIQRRFGCGCGPVFDEIYFPGTGCFSDIMENMMRWQGSRSSADAIFQWGKKGTEKMLCIDSTEYKAMRSKQDRNAVVRDFLQNCEQYDREILKRIENAKEFENFPAYELPAFNDTYSYSGPDWETLKQAADEWENDTLYEGLDDDPGDHYCELAEKNKSRNPLSWFSLDEIEQFIRDNVLPAANEEEDAVEELLQNIIREVPECLEYFTFPDSWHEHPTLVKTILKAYHIPEELYYSQPKVKELKNIVYYESGRNNVRINFRALPVKDMEEYSKEDWLQFLNKPVSQLIEESPYSAQIKEVINRYPRSEVLIDFD